MALFACLFLRLSVLLPGRSLAILVNTTPSVVFCPTSLVHLQVMNRDNIVVRKTLGFAV